MIHLIYDEQDRHLHWARGGMPYPLLLSTDAPPRSMRSGGSPIGEAADQNYQRMQTKLESNDGMLLYTHGLATLLGGDGADCPVSRMLQSTAAMLVKSRARRRGSCPGNRRAATREGTTINVDC